MEFTAAPTVTYDPINGKTTVVVQYTARGADNVALTETQYTSSMLVDNDELDNESLLDSNSEELAVNMHFTEVLDASYSMTQHTPPAFEPMKKAAADTYQGALDEWATRAGEVTFQTIWFAEVLNQSTSSSATSRPWAPSDLLTIPTPLIGESTKMYSAVQKMVELMQADYSKGVAAGPRDHHVMLLFSDGKDNYSYFNNPTAPVPMSTTSGAAYLQYGANSADLEKVKAAIAAHPNLTVHVIGWGSDIDADALQQIADAGNGIFEPNPDSKTLDDLFNQVLQEFTTIQTEGALIPLAPGDYEIAVVIRNGDGSSSDEERFRIHAGDTDARVLP